MTHHLPRIALVGGPDIDARLHLMHGLSGSFELVAVGSDPRLASKFSAAGFTYRNYTLNRQVAPVSDLRSIGELVSIFRKLRPHIVHTFDTKPGVWGCLAASLAGVPIVVCTITGLGGPLSGKCGLEERAAWWMYERLQKLASRISDLTVFQNHDDAREFISAKIVASDKTAVILGSGVPTHLFDPSQFSPDERNRLKQALGIAPGKLVVTMISRLIRSKGILEYSEAARAIRGCYTGAHFLLVGSPDSDSVDRPTPSELNRLRGTVNWIGPRKDIAALLAISELFVLPSAYREGIPRVLLEAAAMGLPIVTTDTPGCHEVVDHGTNGFLVPVRDVEALTRAILELLTRPELRRRFGQASRQRALGSFDLSLVIEQTRLMYQQLLAGSESLALVSACP